MTYQTINPANGEVEKTYEDISDAALDELMDVAQACYQDEWRQAPVANRAHILCIRGLHEKAERSACRSGDA